MAHTNDENVNETTGGDTTGETADRDKAGEETREAGDDTGTMTGDDTGGMESEDQ